MKGPIPSRQSLYNDTASRMNSFPNIFFQLFYFNLLFLKMDSIGRRIIPRQLNPNSLFYYQPQAALNKPGILHSQKTTACDLRDQSQLSLKALNVCNRKIYRSSECSPDMSGLRICKQKLREKQLQIIKMKTTSPKVIRKQKTVCVNLRYIKQIQRRKRAINWIRYNISIGIYYLWAKMRQHLSFYQSLGRIKESHQIQQQINNISQQVAQLVKKYSLSPSNYTKDQVTVQGQQINRKDRVLPKMEISMIVSKKGSIKGHYKSGSVVVQKTEQKQQKSAHKQIGFDPIKKIKKSIVALNSALCLMDRSIILQKQNKFISDFLELSSNGEKKKMNPTQLNELQQILKINERRCEMMNDLVGKIDFLDKNDKSLVLNSQQLKKIEKISLAQQLQQSKNIDQILTKGFITINHFFSQFQTKLTETKKIIDSANCEENGNKIQIQKHKGNEENKKIKKIKLGNNRVSIQSKINLSELNGYQNVPSKISQFWKQNQKGSALKTSKLFRDGEKKKTVEKSMIKFKQIQMDKNQQLDSKKLTSEKKTKKSKKVIAFASTISDQQRDVMETKLSIKKSNSMKSMKNMKSRKQISWQDFQMEGRSFKNIKSLKSLKSLKSIGSASSMNSGKFLRSLKTQRQMKYLHGNLRQISCIRNYRSKLFKLNGELDQQNQTQNQKQQFHLTTEHESFLEQQQEMSERKNITSLNELIFSQQNINKWSPPFQSRKANITKSSKTQQSTAKVSIDEVQRISRRFQRVYEHSDENSNVIRQFLGLFKDIEVQKSLAKRREIVLQQIDKLYESKIINEQEHNKYKAFFLKPQKEGKVINSSLMEEEQSKKENRCNPYISLLEMRKVIEKNEQLNQTNKYYYNFNQFQGEQQQINKTKQIVKKKDQELFNIRTFVQRKPRHSHYEPQLPDTKLRVKEVALNQIDY